MLTINKLRSASPIDYAAEELKKYLRMMMPEKGDIKITYASEAKDGFRLGLLSDVGADIPDGLDPTLDDAIYIETDTRGGIIAGANPRAVLIAVYEYLRKNGCAWLMPGVDGEVIPMKEIIPVSYRHTPTLRIRGNCIEGAVSQQIMADFIDFMPKLGLNTFMMQFRNPIEFYRRYYEHVRNEEKRPPEPINEATSIQWTRALECEMDKRGIMLHSCGHGWNSDSYGVSSSLGWAEADESVIPQENIDCFAMINGKRGFYRSRPTNTQICMSNPRARRMLVNCVCDYADSHSNTSGLHIWLADDSNNHCECEECRKKRTSDWYVTMMNELDGELTRRGNDMKIVFIIYVDTCWPPIEARINNPDRFIAMFAPITRDYSVTLKDGENPETKPYVLNRLDMPRSLGEYISYVDGWKDAYRGDMFAFEYHFWKHHQYDLSGLQIAERIYEDTKCYRDRGINGIMQCGSQRGFTPNGFAFYVHARAQFDLDTPYEQLTREYYSVAYGENWELFRDGLKRLSDAVPYEYIAQPKAQERPRAYHYPEYTPRIESLYGLADRLLTLVRDNYNSSVRARTVLVRILERYLEFVKLWAKALIHKSQGRNEEAVAAYEDIRLYLGSSEKNFDAYDDFLQKSGFTKFMMLYNVPETINNANGE